MKTEIMETRPSAASPLITQEAANFVQGSRAENTRKAYANDWGQFLEWCGARRVFPLPATPETVAGYIADLAGKRKPSTIRRHLASISVAHQAKGLESPTRALLVRTTFAGIRRLKGGSLVKKAPVRVTHLVRLAEVLPDSLQGVRDRAIFLVGYAGAFRRGELVELDARDVCFVPEGVRITVRRSKTDQDGRGVTKDINHASNPQNCPVKALAQWMAAAGIAEGPLFRPVNRHGRVLAARLTPQSVALIVKRVVKALGLDPVKYSGHSLRAGFVTDAIKHGVLSHTIRRVTGHKSESTLAEYYREADMFDYNLLSRLGL